MPRGATSRKLSECVLVVEVFDIVLRSVKKITGTITSNGVKEWKFEIALSTNFTNT
jgi:hypothetical protein